MSLVCVCFFQAATFTTAPNNVVGVDPSVVPDLDDSVAPENFGSGQPNIFNPLARRINNILNPGGPVDDSIELLAITTDSESTLAELLMSTYEFGSPQIVYSVS